MSVIELQEVTKKFGRFHALNKVTVNIQSGVTGLLGPNGAGKSTLIKILLGLLKPTSGGGKVLNFDLRSESRSIRQNVGYMPEDDCFFGGLTGIESVQTAARLSGFGRLEALRRAHEILDFCGANQERYRAVQTYSTGMRQKLRFAMAIVHDPPLLILDEPTSGLDPEERVSMLNRIRILAEKHEKSILICTHILPDIRAISEHVVILANGQVRVAEKLEVLARPSSPAIQVRTNEMDNRAFQSRLKDWQLDVEPREGGVLSVSGQVPDGCQTLTAAIWKAAAESDVGLRGLTPAKNSLEEIFIQAVKSSSAAENSNATA